MNISLLSEHSHYKIAVAQMIYNEFVVGTVSTKTLTEVEQFLHSQQPNELPLTFVATINNQAVGTVSLFANDFKARPDYTPWLASLYVLPAFRSQKIGEQLIQFLIGYTKSQGYSSLYLKTEHAPHYYEARGWTCIEKVDNNDEVVHIFQQPLSTATGGTF